MDRILPYTPENMRLLSPEGFCEYSREFLLDAIKSGRCEIDPEKKIGYEKDPEKTWWSGLELSYMTKLLGLDVAYYNIDGKHWNLILSIDDDFVRLYDPITTDSKENIKKIRTEDIKESYLVISDKLQYDLDYKMKSEKKVHKEVNIKLESGIKILAEEKGNLGILEALKMNYKALDDGFIDKIGSIQEDSWNCGPLVLYAAIVSKYGSYYTKEGKSEERKKPTILKEEKPGIFDKIKNYFKKK